MKSFGEGRIMHASLKDYFINGPLLKFTVQLLPGFKDSSH